MITFHKLFEIARREAEQELGHAIDDEYVAAITRGVMKALDLSIDQRTGEVVDPRPKPAAIPEQRNARWSGSGRRRR